MMAGRIIGNQKKDKKARLNSNLYDGYAIYCDKDRPKINKLLWALNRLDLRIHCKDDAVCGNRMFDAIVQNGIFASKCCLLFVSSDFKNDPLCVFLAEMALLRYLHTYRKHRIITICLDSTNIPYFGIFKKISINKYSLGTIPEIILDEKLIRTIYKAMKGPRKKPIFYNWMRCHCCRPYSLKKKRRNTLFKSIKRSKFSRFKFTLEWRGCRMLNLSNLICKCLFDSHLWRKLVKLITQLQVLPIIQHYFPTNLEYHIQQHIKIGPSVCNLEEQLLHTRCAPCRFCHTMVLKLQLTQHEDECQKPINCETCNRVISRGHKKEHENKCIFDECSTCNEFHAPSHNCTLSNSQATGLWEEMESSFQDEFSSLNSVASQKCTEHSDVKKTVDTLMDIVSNLLSKKKKKKKKTEYNCNDLIDQLLDQLKRHEIIDQNKMETIYKTAENNVVPVAFSANSLNYFRNFVFAMELHCSNISLFENKPLVEKVMCNCQSPPKKTFFDIFRMRKDPQKNNQTDSGQVFPSLVQNLYMMK